MAESDTYETTLLLEAKIQPGVEKSFAVVQKNIKNIKKSAGRIGKSFNKVGKSIKNMAGNVVNNPGFEATINFMKGNVEAARVQSEVETRLKTLLKQRTGATDEQIKSVMQLAAAQQKLGVIDDEVQKAGAQQLATNINSVDAIKTLLPAMNNLLARQKGLNAARQDAVSVGQMMREALSGQLGGLKSVGISFTKAQEEILKYGNEQEKSALLARVITDNVGEMNKALAETNAGKIQKAKNTVKDFREELGEKLMPVQAAAVSIWEGFNTAVQMYQSVASMATTAQWALNAAMNASPAAIITVSIAALAAVGWLVYKNWSKIGPFLMKIWDGIKNFVVNSVKYIGDFLNSFPLGRSFLENISTMAAAVKQTFGGVVSFFKSVFSGDLTGALQAVQDIFSGVFGGIAAYIRIPINTIISLINKGISALNKLQIKVPDWVPGLGGKEFGFNISPIPMLAKGMGNFPGGLALVGEKGPELVNLPGGSQISSTSRTERLLQGLDSTGDKKSFNINWNPQITVKGKADKEDIKKVLIETKEDFREMLTDVLGFDPRTSFAQ